MNQIEAIKASSIEALLQTLGRRLKQQKTRLRIGGRRVGDAQLATLSGVSRSTLIRLWQGQAIGTDNLLRVVRALGRLDLLYPLLVDEGPSPLERLVPPRRRRRVRTPAAPSSADTSPRGSTPRAPLADAEALRRKYQEDPVD